MRCSCVLLCALLLLVLEGPACAARGRADGRRRPPRPPCWRSAGPAGWVGRPDCRSPTISHDATAWLSPGRRTWRGDGFADAPAPVLEEGRQLPVTPDAFDPAALGASPPRRSASCGTLLVTGDSLSTPLDAEMAQRLAGEGVDGDPRPAPRHRHLEEPAGRLGQLSADQVERAPPRRRGGLHRRQRGLPDAGPRGQGGRVLRRRTGRRSTPPGRVA